MTSERRQVRRYPLIVTVELEKGEAITRDVSTFGVYFVTDVGYAVGEAIGFSLDFQEPGQASPLRTLCAGRVVRVEPCEGRWGVAVCITSTHFGAPDGR